MRNAILFLLSRVFLSNSLAKRSFAIGNCGITVVEIVEFMQFVEIVENVLPIVCPAWTWDGLRTVTQQSRDSTISHTSNHNHLSTNQRKETPPIKIHYMYYHNVRECRRWTCSEPVLVQRSLAYQNSPALRISEDSGNSTISISSTISTVHGPLQPRQRSKSSEPEENR